MSKRIVTVITPVAGLLAAALTTSVVGAAPMSHHRQYQASAPHGRATHYAPISYGRVAPTLDPYQYAYPYAYPYASGRGAFEETTDSAP